jgi:hypothetical protein
MSLSLVKYEEDLHKELVAPWFEAKGDGPAVNWLPVGSTYLVNDKDHGLVAIGSLLLTNSKLCFMEHLTTDPSQRQITQGKALRFVVLSLEQIAKSLSYDVILGLVPEDHFALAEFYKRQGAFLGSKLMRVTYKPLK